MPTINVPGIGNVEKKYVYIGAAGIAGFAGFMFWRSKKAPATDPNATDPNATDPNATGDPGTFDPNSSTPYDYTGSTPTYQAPYNQYIPWTSNQQINTDAAWDAAVLGSADDMGLGVQLLSGAIGRYLHGDCMSSTQADAVRQAIALWGRPPQSPNLAIKICPGGTGSGSTGGKKGSELAAPTGLHVTALSTTRVKLTWSAVTGASSYRAYRADVGSNIGGTSSTSIDVGGLSKGHTYKFHVRAVGSDGKPGPASATISVKTKTK